MKPTDKPAAGGRRGNADSDTRAMLRRMAGEQLAQRIQAGELSSAELLKVLSLPGEKQPAPLPLDGQGDLVITWCDDA